MEVINNIKQKAEQLIQQGFETDAGTYIHRGWELFQDNIGMFIGYTLLTLAISVAAAFVPFGSILVSGPLTAGFYIVANKISKGEPYEFGTFFKGFDFFVPLLLWSLIGGIFIALGMVALIVPGIYLAVAYTFAPLFIVFAKMEFWDGVEYIRVCPAPFSDQPGRHPGTFCGTPLYDPTNLLCYIRCLRRYCRNRIKTKS